VGSVLYFTLGEVVVVLLFGLGVVHFMASIRVRELAVQAVRLASERDEFQLLDQSVHIQRMSLSRDDEGRWRLWRQYRFDYSYEGVERRQGHVIMLGRKLQALVISERGQTLH
jgi:hypothetical protein